MSDSANITGKGGRHWPSLILGLIVIVIFLFAIFYYQVDSTQTAVVTRFGKITGVKGAGLHFKWPYPIEKVEKFDNRLRCFEGSVGKLEETITADSKNLIIGLYVIYKIEDVEKLFRNVKDIFNAEDRLNNIIRSEKNAVVGKHRFDEFVNTDPAKMKLGDIETQIFEGAKGKALEDYGLQIVSVGIKQLSVPEKTSEQVFNRMKEERGVVAQKYRSEGENIAKQIISEADSKKKLKLADAEASAKKIRAEGDAKAASYYSVFKEDPALADFLRKLDALRRIMPKKTTLILNTQYPPFDLLSMDPGKLNDLNAKKSIPLLEPDKK